LNEHLLGHIFEESLSDLEDLGSADAVPLDVKMRERKRGGIFFTTSVLSDFLAASAIKSYLDERAPVAPSSDVSVEAAIRERISALVQVRIVDFACGSGAFLVSAYREML
jgi:type I restriction-modification system DNA methylase subunit